MADNAVDKTIEKAQDDTSTVLEKAKQAEGQVLDAVDTAQENIGKATPVTTKAEYDTVATPSDVKSRLDWGEPALTIIDIRDREAFNNERIMGAVSMPTDVLVERVKQSMTPERDIFVYGESDKDTSAAAIQLQEAGFQKVSVIKGGLPAWKAINGAVEGRGQAPGLLEKGGASLTGQNATP
ncbi:rhodanese-like domain-containing protein [cf. Phormidesmis sp. LEGE 11477]|uniref:rhodanese-like domain-containing protein n=1 Tax=cf. Phormidesmis sp. LEGE 11477 TaxID=1828680 RepID=UPI00187F3D22|nr:rhodanese-like domain-containing protein [cf. Phormidesmis sp. LEGE 11477]MBE9064568.1 rhodanese-like domain-containing protein [cf. Phormidesmis sp. LEGE 11477]